jgi:signal recognition particle subunit SRP54
MFNQLTERLTQSLKRLSGEARFTEQNTQQALRDVRVSLLEADVALPVIKDFIDTLKQKILGQDVSLHLKPEQALLQIVRDELVHLMGDEHVELELKTQPPAVILLAGLQGSGKTTTAAKLARRLTEHDKKKVMLVSADVYRPAAIEQLARLCEDLNLAFFPSTAQQLPVDIVTHALAQAKKQGIEVLIVDTAGRLHVDADMMSEIKQVHAAIQPIETLFVIDSMTGQDAVHTAQAFHSALPLTGVILTKTDGDARGGAALSIRHITGLPIKFMGTGEKTDALERFHPDRVASRILGMGDLLSLIEDVEQKTNKAAQDKFTQKIKTGKSFDFNDFREQLLQMNQMGGIAGMMNKLPGMNQLSQQINPQNTEKTLAQTIAIINSMTKKERRIPKLIIGSRKRRIAMGSGTQIQDVNRLLKQFEQMQKMMKKLGKAGGLQNMMRGMGGMGGLGSKLLNPFSRQ